MISGSLECLHFGDLLQWFQMGSVSGRLTLRDRRGERRLDFREGRICYASSSVAGERLASWVARRGLLGADELRRLLAASMLRRTLFTDLLLAHGVLDRPTLEGLLAELAEVIASRLLVAREVHFEFDPSHPVLDVLGLSLSVQPSHLLMGAARRTDEYAQPLDETTEHGLPLTGAAFEGLFWDLVRSGVTSEDPVNGDELGNLHDLVRDIVGTLAQWLATSPGLVPMPRLQVAGLGRTSAEGEPVGLFGAPHAAWNQMVFARSVATGEGREPSTMAALERSAAELDAWPEFADARFLHRPDVKQLDHLTRRVVVAWSRASAAAAPHLGLNADSATMAVHLVAVPTDLVLWVLATLPVPHRGLRRALIDRLPRRIGAALARLADFPAAFREVLEGHRPTPLGVCLDLGRAHVPSASTWPATVPPAGGGALEIVTAPALALAADAVREAADGGEFEPLAAV